MPEYLLHSLSTFEEIILHCFGLAEVRTIVEIGSESGAFTESLVGWSEERGGWVASIDPEPSDLTRELAARSTALRLIEGRSPDGLQGLDPADAYVVDGDHNYWTVKNELDAIYAAGREQPPLSVLHDVGWPCARRDQYYEPGALPADAVLPNSRLDGAVPWSSDLTPRAGFSGAGQFGRAEQEGGEGNGVLTAVEDFLAQHDELEFVRIPAIFGVGVIFPSGAPYAGQMREFLAPYHEMPLLDRMERNRVELYVTVIQLEREAKALRAFREKALERIDELESRLSGVELSKALESATDPRSNGS